MLPNVGMYIVGELEDYVVCGVYMLPNVGMYIVGELEDYVVCGVYMLPNVGMYIVGELEDYVVCGVCQHNFSLNNMSAFIQHKRLDCQDDGGFTGIHINVI